MAQIPGKLTAYERHRTLRTYSFEMGATGTVVPAVAGRVIKVYAYKLVVSAACAVKWRSGAGTDIEGLQSYGANSGAVENVNPPNFILATVAGQSLDLVISGAATVSGRVSYWDDDQS